MCVCVCKIAFERRGIKRTAEKQEVQQIAMRSSCVHSGSCYLGYDVSFGAQDYGGWCSMLLQTIGNDPFKIRISYKGL